LEPGSWIAIYLPLLVAMMAAMQQDEYRKILIIKRRKRRGIMNMTNELLNRHIGKRCKISSGSYGSTVTGRILEVKDNWIEVETGKGLQLVNAEFVQTVKVMAERA
jgi:hypothetical protein